VLVEEEGDVVQLLDVGLGRGVDDAGDGLADAGVDLAGLLDQAEAGEAELAEELEDLEQLDVDLLVDDCARSSGTMLGMLGSLLVSTRCQRGMDWSPKPRAAGTNDAGGLLLALLQEGSHIPAFLLVHGC
jgi:hypothetical protein